MTEFICMNRLNPFGTGKVFKPIKTVTSSSSSSSSSSSCLNPFGTGKVFKLGELLVGFDLRES